MAIGAVLGACGDDGGGAAVDAAMFDAAGDAPACPATTTIFLNRGGGTYTRGAADDSSSNLSSIVPGPTTIPVPTVVEADWTAFVSCVRSKFEPFNVTVTDQDPGSTVHTELAVIDQPQQIGLGADVPGVAPYRCASGGGPFFNQRAITFLMWGVADDLTSRCWVGTQVLGSSFGLDHVFSCPDLMSYLDGCGDKTFTDADVRCGENEERDCLCGGATQDSLRYLTSTLGAAGCR